MEESCLYESKPCTVIIYLGNKLYKTPEVATPITISLISAKKWNEIISQKWKFVFILIFSQSKGKNVATTMALGKGSSMQQKQVDAVME